MRWLNRRGPRFCSGSGWAHDPDWRTALPVRRCLLSRRGDSRPVVALARGPGSVASAAAALSVPGIEAVVGLYVLQPPDEATPTELVSARDSIASRLR